MAIETNLAEAIQELHNALDPDQLAQELLTDTGQAAVQMDQSHPHDGWTDDTGTLHESFEITVLKQGNDWILEEENAAPYAEYVHVMEGRSVLRAFDSGR